MPSPATGAAVGLLAGRVGVTPAAWVGDGSDPLPRVEVGATVGAAGRVAAVGARLGEGARVGVAAIVGVAGGATLVAVGVARTLPTCTAPPPPHATRVKARPSVIRPLPSADMPGARRSSEERMLVLCRTTACSPLSSSIVAALSESIASGAAADFLRKYEQQTPDCWRNDRPSGRGSSRVLGEDEAPDADGYARFLHGRQSRRCGFLDRRDGVAHCQPQPCPLDHRQVVLLIADRDDPLARDAEVRGEVG